MEKSMKISKNTKIKIIRNIAPSLLKIDLKDDKKIVKNNFNII